MTETLCMAVAIVVILVLVYLGCSEFSRMRASTSARRSTRSAKNVVVVDPKEKKKHDAKHDAAHDLPEPRKVLKGTQIHDAFAEMEVDRSMARLVQQDTSDVGTEFFLQEFHDEDANSFRPVNKEAAMKAANVRPGQQMQNGRSDGAPPARMIGLSPMEFARKTIQRPVAGSSCMSFNDTDARHMLINDHTDCFATESCPWQK